MFKSLFAPKAANEPAAGAAGGGAVAARERDLPAVAPAVDIWEDERRVVVEADLPGVATDAVDIQVHRGVLTIRATPAAVDEDKLQPLHREWQTAAFVRSFTLADELDDQAVTAKVVNGVLRVELPKRASAQPRRIQVSAA